MILGFLKTNESILLLFLSDMLLEVIELTNFLGWNDDALFWLLDVFDLLIRSDKLEAVEWLLRIENLFFSFLNEGN